MERTLIHMIIVGSIFGLTKGNVLPADLNAAVGGNVMFKTTLDPTPTPFLSVNWIFHEVGPIMTSTSASNIVAPGYEDRVSLFTSTGSLELRHVSLSDTGRYVVSIITQAGLPLGGTTTLTVQVPVSDVSVSTNSTDLMEFSSVHLSCSSSGSSPSYRWFNDSSEVTASDRVQLSSDNAILTIVSVTRYDQGPFKCLVSNLVSNATSRPVNFIIRYGPYNVKISGPTKVKWGQSLKLECVAESVPSADYTWRRDGERVLNNSDVFVEHRMVKSATYTCEAKNSVTGRLAYGQHHLTVKEDKPLSVGAIVGIVMACLLAGGGVFGGVGYGYIKKKKNKAQSPTDE